MAFFNNNPPNNSQNGKKSDKKVKNSSLNLIVDQEMSKKGKKLFLFELVW